MDVWLKSGFLIPCIRLMWLSRREGRGKLGPSSVQYLQEYSPKTGSKTTGPRKPSAAAHARQGGEVDAASGSGGESLEQAASWLGVHQAGRLVLGTPQRNGVGKPAKVADKSKSEYLSWP